MEFREKIGVNAVRVALAVFATGTLMAAQAQEQTAPNTDKVERVVITGSNIKSVDAESTSPVQVIKREDIMRQGVTNVADLIGNLSAASTNGSNLSDIGGSNSFAPGGTSVGLRNLGEQSTLVLLNGRRLPVYALADYTNVFSNVDAIPLDAIERIEVLKTGASAIYGSDAVAGVINIITKTNYQGLDVTADRTQSSHGGAFGTSKASITGGFGDYDKDGYNVLLNADFYKRDSTMWTNLLQYTNPDLLKYSPNFGKYSTYSYPGNIVDSTVTPVPGCAPSLIQGGACKYNKYERFQAVPESQRANFYGSGTLDLGGGTQAFGEVLYSKITTKYISAFTYYGDGLGTVGWGNPTTGQPLTFNYLGLPATNPLNSAGEAGAALRYRFVDAPTFQNVDSTEYRAIGGLRGTFKDFDWETAAGVMGSKTSTTQRGAFSSSGFISTIGDYTKYVANTSSANLAYTATDPNFFNQPNGYHPGKVNSAAVLNTLFPAFGYEGKDSQAFVDAKVSGTLAKLPAGDLGFAFGGEIRHESYSNTPSSNLLNGDIVGYGASSSDASRNTSSLFTEFNIPVFKKFEISAAARVDKYPELSAHFSPRLAFRYTPTDSILLRGTIENGFRAPNMVESAQSTKYAYQGGTTDPLRCQQATNLQNDLINKANALSPSDPQVALLYARAEAVYSQECNFGLAIKTLNNPALQPEKSQTISVGIVIEPVKNYTASFDYWHIDRKGTIGIPSISQVLNGGPLPTGTSVNRAKLNPATDPTFTSAEVTTYGVADGPLQNVTQLMENMTEQITSGLDVGLKGKTKFDKLGTLRFALDGTYLFSYKDSNISDITENLAGQYGYSHVTANATVSLETGNFTNGFRLNYNDGYALQLGKYDATWNASTCKTNKVNACYVASQQTVDYFFVYNGFKNTVITANVMNVFNQLAATDIRAFGIGGAIPTSLQDGQGRMFKLSLQYKFK